MTPINNKHDAVRLPLSVSHPRIAVTLADDSVTADDVVATSSRVLTWAYPCGHTARMAVRKRVGRRGGCPRCRDRAYATDTRTLAVTHPALCRQWRRGPGGLRPRDVRAGSGRVVTWCCPVCRHRWPAAIRTRTAGHDCPSCCNGSRIATPWTCLAATHPRIAREFIGDPAHRHTPYTVTAGSNVTLLWRHRCGTVYPARVSNRALRGSGCPSCGGRVASPRGPRGNLAAAAPDLAAEFLAHPLGKSAAQLRPHSRDVVVWRCRCGGTWTASVLRRYRGMDRCPHCHLQGKSSEVEVRIRAELSAVLGKLQSRHLSVPGLPRGLRPDMILDGSRLVITYDGRYWHQRPGAIDRDERQWQALTDADWTVVRLREEPLPLVHPGDVTVVPPGRDPRLLKAAALTGLTAVAAAGIPVPRLEEYRASPDLWGTAQAQRDLDKLTRPRRPSHDVADPGADAA